MSTMSSTSPNATQDALTVVQTAMLTAASIRVFPVGNDWYVSHDGVRAMVYPTFAVAFDEAVTLAGEMLDAEMVGEIEL